MSAVWLVTEQVAVAALDTRAFELAIELVRDVKKKFPDSQRTVRLTVRFFPLRNLLHSISCTPFCIKTDGRP